MYTHRSRATLVALAFAALFIINAAAFGAGESSPGMVPRTAAPIMRGMDHAPSSREHPNHPSAAPPILIGNAEGEDRGHRVQSANGTAQDSAVRMAKRKSSRRPCSDINQCSYVERFRRVTDRWIAANDYANGVPFDAWWSRNRAVINMNEGHLRLSVERSERFGKRYVAGQLQSTKWHGYGCYEVRMRPTTQEGLISTFFTYTGQYDRHPGATSRHNEVDIEFVYKANRGKFMMQANYFTNGRGGNEHYIDLPFRPERRFHNYGMRWAPWKIDWYVDGRKVYTARRNIPQARYGNHKIMMNLWPVQEVAAGWGGYYQYRGPQSTVYKAVRFTRGANCRIQNRF